MNTDYLYLLFVLAPLLLLLYLRITSFHVNKFTFKDKHVVITGGSSGIGLACAIKLVQLDAHVTIMARNKSNLDKAVDEIKKHVKNGSDVQVHGISVDVSDVKAVQQAIQQAQHIHSRIDAAILSAGQTQPQLIDDISEMDFDRLMKVNYLGVVYVTKQLLPLFKQQKGGRIVYVSSMAGMTGTAGYTAYSATKFAVRGFAESLQMEVKRDNIYITVCNPPDTMTPMYEEEMKIKPEECRLISQGVGCFSAEAVADSILSSLKHWQFFVSTGMDGWLLNQISVGMAPSHSTFSSLFQICFAGILRAVTLAYIWSYYRICDQVKTKKINSATTSTPLLK